MSLDADTPLPSSVNTDILVPLDQYKEPILWDENLATIPCILAAVGKYLKRNGLFGPLLEQRAVALSNGKLGHWARARRRPARTDVFSARVRAHAHAHARRRVR